MHVKLFDEYLYVWKSKDTYFIIQPMNLVTKIKFEEAPPRGIWSCNAQSQQSHHGKMRKAHVPSYNTYKNMNRNRRKDLTTALLHYGSISNCQTRA